MKKRLNFMVGLGLLILGSACAQQPETITIRGKVQFPDNGFPMEIVRYEGFDKIVVDSCPVKEDGTYEFRLKVENPGAYSLNCQKWQDVRFWAENEDLQIDFRGMDTAKIKIKNPPYVYIQGGPANELMNLMNWEVFRNYQQMIGIAQQVYALEELDAQAKQDMSMKFYNLLNEDFTARLRYLAEHYADRNSILAVLPMLRGQDAVVEQALARLETRNPGYAPLRKYKADRAEAKALKERVAEGRVAPDFSFPTPDGKQKLGPRDFRGKILVLDFWASWCGPCRAEIPHLKEAYLRYHDKGVEFFSVSIDKDAAAWKKAMQEEKMPWQQVQAPQGGKEVMKEYQFSGIPHILLLDQEGKIIGKNLRGKALMEKIEEVTGGKQKEMNH